MKLPAVTGVSLPDAAGSLLLPMVAGVLAIITGIILAAGPLGTQQGLWQYRTGFELLRYGACCGAATLLVGVAVAIHAGRKRNRLGLVLALVAALSGAFFAALPLKWKLAAERLPPIHDITTDTTNPPSFVALLPLRKNAPNPAAYGGPAVAALQRQGYPDIKSAVLKISPADAYDKALATASAMKWQIVAAVPAEGRIEAVATTFWFAFEDDVVIRITPAGNRSLVDIRSASRGGTGDAGTNAWRIRSYVKKLTD